MASVLAAPYTAQPVSYAQKYAYVTAPQPPPSPPMDETSKCSLPSISSLLGLADVGSPKEQAARGSYPRQVSPQQGLEHRSTQPVQQYASGPASSSRGALPPTPPMHTDSAFDGRQSPSAASTSQYSVASAPSYFFSQQPAASSINNVDSIPRRVSMPASSPSYQQRPYHASQYNGPSSSQSSYFSSPVQAAPSQVSGLYYQRPLPQTFPPAVSMGMPTSNGPNPWQHHHYISPSAQASFPQSQDRYICQTCSKAFSRPSSLRIHSHSHTGEKPFKCPHQGCGKAFSVRSNMKRHERGCHTFEASGLL